MVSFAHAAYASPMIGPEQTQPNAIVSNWADDFGQWWLVYEPVPPVSTVSSSPPLYVLG